MKFELVQLVDAEVAEALNLELNRQQDTLEMIASENFVSAAVLQAMGSIMTNKYAEGYPGKRYYGGCEYVDIPERLACLRAKKLFNAEYANVQPHSGSQANMGAYFSVLTPGDKIVGMSLSHGGHLTHGSPVNFSGRTYEVSSYGVDPDTGRIDYDQLEKLAREVEPKMIIAGFSAYPRQLDYPRFRQISDKVGAILLSDIAHIAGLVATGEHPSPFPYCDIVTSTTHKTLRGPRGGLILSKEKYAKDIDKSIFPGIQGGPFMHIIAGKAVCFKEAMSDDFKTYQHRVVENARTLAEALICHGFDLVSGGTDNHLMLVDLNNKDITGKECEKLLEKAGITVNKNTVPKETRSPFVTSGIRIGTPALTTRGMGVGEMKKIAGWIDRAVTSRNNETEILSIRKEILGMTKQFPLYKD